MGHKMDNKSYKVGEKVIITETGEIGEIIYIDKESYLVAKNCSKYDIQFYNVKSLGKIKKE